MFHVISHPEYLTTMSSRYTSTKGNSPNNIVATLRKHAGPFFTPKCKITNKRTLLTMKRSHLMYLLVQTNILIPSEEVEVCEHLSTRHVINKIIDVRKKPLFGLQPFIQRFLINKKPCPSAFLRGNHDCEPPRRVRGPYYLLLQHLLNFLSNNRLVIRRYLPYQFKNWCIIINSKV